MIFICMFQKSLKIMNVAIPITKENVMEEKNASFHEIYGLLVRISDICTHDGLNR